MTGCHACGSEIIGRDRFCRKCGASVPTSVADLVDTRQLNPNAPPPAVGAHGSREFTAQFYTPPAAYQPGGNVAPIYQTGSLKKKSGTWKIILLVCVLMLSIFVATGIVVSIQGRRNRQNQTANTVRVRSFQESFRNALGVELSELSKSDFPEVDGGFVNRLMRDDGPAGLAKVEAGDVITSLNGQAVKNLNELMQVLDSIRPGTEVPIAVYRDGETVNSKIKVDNPSFAPRMPEPKERDQGFLGVNGDVGSRKFIPSVRKWGVALSDPTNNGPADLAGLQGGDIITEFDGHVIRTREELQRRIRTATPRKKVQVKFYRGSVEQIAEILMGHRG